MRISKRWQAFILSAIFIFGCAFFGPSRLTQTEAEAKANIFCLPTYLPAKVDPVPDFYALDEESEIPMALYKNTETSERVFAIFMMSETSKVLDGDYRYYDPYMLCEDIFELPNGFRVCNASTWLREVNLDEYLPGEGPPFVTYLDWLMQRDEQWAMYNLESSLSLEETKKIAASMCLE